MDKLRSFRGWFYAAALYNALWGAWVALQPRGAFDLLQIPAPSMLAIWQCVGMIVGLYGFGYWLVARDPAQYGPFAMIVLLGKVLGPIGFFWSASKGELPWAFGWVNVTNDLIWLPAFSAFCWRWWQWNASQGKA